MPNRHCPFLAECQKLTISHPLGWVPITASFGWVPKAIPPISQFDFLPTGHTQFGWVPTADGQYPYLGGCHQATPLFDWVPSFNRPNQKFHNLNESQ
jgi:hypothetical protein